MLDPKRLYDTISKTVAAAKSAQEAGDLEKMQLYSSYLERMKPVMQKFQSQPQALQREQLPPSLEQAKTQAEGYAARQEDRRANPFNGGPRMIYPGPGMESDLTPGQLDQEAAKSKARYQNLHNQYTTGKGKPMGMQGPAGDTGVPGPAGPPAPPEVFLPPGIDKVPPIGPGGAPFPGPMYPGYWGMEQDPTNKFQDPDVPPGGWPSPNSPALPKPSLNNQFLDIPMMMAPGPEGDNDGQDAGRPQIAKNGPLPAPPVAEGEGGVEPLPLPDPASYKSLILSSLPTPQPELPAFDLRRKVTQDPIKTELPSLEKMGQTIVPALTGGMIQPLDKKTENQFRGGLFGEGRKNPVKEAAKDSRKIMTGEFDLSKPPPEKEVKTEPAPEVPGKSLGFGADGMAKDAKGLLEKAVAVAAKDKQEAEIVSRIQKELGDEPSLFSLENLAMMLLIGAPKTYSKVVGEKQEWRRGKRDIHNQVRGEATAKERQKKTDDWREREVKANEARSLAAVTRAEGAGDNDEAFKNARSMIMNMDPNSPEYKEALMYLTKSIRGAN